MLRYTGERVIPDAPESAPGTLIYETHAARYRFASTFVHGKRVLDVACGTGYGSHILRSSGAVQVVGGDIAYDAVAYAKRRYGAIDVAFVAMQATHIPIGTQSIDVAVSFETIEHLKEPRAFLLEIRRVLKRDGVFIVSTPNRLTYGAGNNNPDNEFHAQEYSLEEFLAALQEVFSNVRVYAQRSLKRQSALARHVHGFARQLRIADRLGLRRLVPRRFRRIVNRSVDAFDPNVAVLPMRDGTSPLFFVVIATPLPVEQSAPRTQRQVPTP